MSHSAETSSAFPTIESVASVVPGRFAYAAALRGLLASAAARDASVRVETVSRAMATIVSCDEQGAIEPPLTDDLSNLVHSAYINADEYFEDSEKVINFGPTLPGLIEPVRTYNIEKIEVSELILAAVVQHGGCLANISGSGLDG